MKSWTYTDDPNDPCVYCVQWRCAVCKSQDWPMCCDEAQLDGNSEPFWPDGTVVPRVFNGCCERCEESIALMHQQHQDDMSLGQP